jgi:prophage antirepressor-like protein
MPSNIIAILQSPVGRLETLPGASRIWVRVSGISDTLGIGRSTFYDIIRRDPSLVPADHTELVSWPSEGGDQPTRVYSLDVVLNVAMEVNNKKARKLRRWLVAMLRGEAPVKRPPADPLQRLPEAKATLAHPHVQAAIAKLDEADRLHADAMRAQQARYREADRLAALAGYRRADVMDLRKIQRLLDRLPARPAQPGLPLDG